jgi:hypothetical protein
MKAGWMTMPLAFVATFAFLFVVGTSGAGVDADVDGDGVQNNMDNCSDAASPALSVNPSQTDSDQDGYGNACDGDYNQDGIVGGPDFSAFAGAFGSVEGDPSFVHAIDCNDDGIIGGPDFTCFAIQFNNGRNGSSGGPGPSGRSCVIAPGSNQTAICPAPGILGMPRAASLP